MSLLPKKTSPLLLVFVSYDIDIFSYALVKKPANKTRTLNKNQEIHK
jgi:hypothetical protein